MTNEEPSGDMQIQTRALPQRRKRYKIVVLSLVGALFLAITVVAISVYAKTNAVRLEMMSAEKVSGALRSAIQRNDARSAEQSARELADHTGAARGAASGVAWSAAEVVPVFGANFQAVREMTTTADDVARLGILPLTEVLDGVDWKGLIPGSGLDLQPIKDAEPKLTAAAQAVSMSSSRLNMLDPEGLISEIASPLNDFKDQLRNASSALDVAADVSRVAPRMAGADRPRSYLLMIQNNAEARASGGIPGALAILTLDKGKLSLGTQRSAAELGVVAPSLSVDPEQQQIYSARLGKYMQDVNLTPDFPTAAATAKGIWEKKTGQRVDGVISIDPVVLSYILQSTGPVSVDGPELAAVKAAGLPTQLTGSNVVPTLLSDVYTRIQKPALQDVYFAGVAKEVFSALSTGKGEAKGLLAGLTRGTEEGRVLLWSVNPEEQSVLSKYLISGSVSGPSVSAAQYGAYFNDGTGAKMDYYVKRTVQLIRECPADGYQQTRVRVTSTNTAPPDAATALPSYVTGGGAFGVAPGTVQTNIIAYGPVQANVESATVDGQKTPFAPHLHANRPVGVVAQQLAPGESRTVEFTFGKIVQHTEPNLVVTPTVQPVKDVVLPTESPSCIQGQ